MGWLALLLSVCLIAWLFYRFTKPMIKITIGLVCVAVAVYGYMIWMEVSAKRLLDKVVTKGGLDKQCEYPNSLLIITNNETNKVVTKRWISLSGYRKGYSDKVYSGQHVSDKIIEAGETWAECVSAPGKNYGYEGKLPNLSDVRWEIMLTNASFK